MEALESWCDSDIVSLGSAAHAPSSTEAGRSLDELDGPRQPRNSHRSFESKLANIKMRFLRVKWDKIGSQPTSP